MKGLSGIRKKIDGIDRKIVTLLNDRARLTLEVRKLKTKTGQGLFSPGREREVYEKLSQFNRGPMKSETVRSIFREIMSASLALEKPIRIAYLGPAGTFTHQAALVKFGSQVDYVECDLISDVFAAVEKRDAHYGIVPIENSIEGAVDYTLDMFIDSSVKVCSEGELTISHHLLGKGALSKVRTLYSMRQVFGQCRQWLARELPHVRHLEVASTALGAAFVATQPASKGLAAIAGEVAASQYRLEILARSIEDHGIHNVTRFLVIGQETPPPTGHDKTSILFSVKDRVGALYDMLVPFRKAGINLAKIESRPSKKKPWEYYFFVDLVGHVQEARVNRALRDLEGACTFLKILGSYPIAVERNSRRQG